MRVNLNDCAGGWLSMYCDSEGPTRSPSPAPSSGVESNSFKESPMQIDVLNTEGTSIGKCCNVPSALCFNLYISVLSGIISLKN